MVGALPVWSVYIHVWLRFFHVEKEAFWLTTFELLRADAHCAPYAFALDGSMLDCWMVELLAAGDYLDRLSLLRNSRLVVSTNLLLSACIEVPLVHLAA